MAYDELGYEKKIEVIQRRAVRPLEEYVEGPPPEVEVAPLREEPVPVTKRTTPVELTSIIEHLRADTVESTQLLIEFPEGTGWVRPVPRFTLFFKKPEGRVVGSLHGARDPEELKEYQRTLEPSYPGSRIERHYRADKDTWYFWAFPEERKPIYRDNAYGMALEILKLKPTRLSIQHVPRMIHPPPGVRPEELPFRLREMPEERRRY